MHTNGYPLVRHVLGLDGNASPLHEFHPELGKDVGVRAAGAPWLLLPAGPARSGHGQEYGHITGGGLVENLPGALPTELGSRFDTAAWVLPPIYPVLQERGSVARDEMYRVYNMGPGLVMVCDPSRAEEITSLVPEAKVVGGVIPAAQERCIIL